MRVYKYKFPFLNLRIKLYLSFNSIEKYCFVFFFFGEWKKVRLYFFLSYYLRSFWNWLDLSSIFTWESIFVLFSNKRSVTGEVIYRENKYRIVDENGLKSVLKIKFHFAKHPNNLNHGLVKKVKCVQSVQLWNSCEQFPSFN